MASPTQRTWLWASSGSWWRTGKPGVLQSMGSQVGHDWMTYLTNWRICQGVQYAGATRWVWKLVPRSFVWWEMQSPPGEDDPIVYSCLRRADTCTPSSHSSVDGHLGCFHDLTIINSEHWGTCTCLNYGLLRVLYSECENWKTPQSPPQSVPHLKNEEHQDPTWPSIWSSPLAKESKSQG